MTSKHSKNAYKSVINKIITLTIDCEGDFVEVEASRYNLLKVIF